MELTFWGATGVGEETENEKADMNFKNYFQRVISTLKKVKITGWRVQMWFTFDISEDVTCDLRPK